MGMIINPYRFAAASVDASISGASTSNVDATVNATHTHSSMSFGAADSTRILIAAISITPNGAIGALSSVTIGGVSGSLVVRTGASQEGCEIWAAAVPTGTSGNVVLVNSTNLYSTEVFLYRMLNGQATAHATATNEQTTSPVSTTLTIPAGGVGIGVTTHRIDNPGTTYTWTGLTEDYEAPIYSTAGEGGTAASLATASLLTSLAITVTAASAGLRHKGVFASFPRA